jgi:hypothetical protein
MSSESLTLDETEHKMMCLPLYSILLALGNPTVNYFRYFHPGTYLNGLYQEKFFKWAHMYIE